jgi:hypothetical protein
LKEGDFMQMRWTAIAFVGCAGCTAGVAYGAPPHSVDAKTVQAETGSEPVVGRLKTRHRTVDLTASAFAPGRNDVPREAIAVQVMADIDRDMTSRSSGRGESFGTPRR